MIRLPTVALFLALGAFVTGCARNDPPMSPEEEKAVGRLGRDPWTDIQRIERTSPGILMVTTRQGEDTVAYQLRLVIDDKGREEVISQRLPIRVPLNGRETTITRDSTSTEPPYMRNP